MEDIAKPCPEGEAGRQPALQNVRSLVENNRNSTGLDGQSAPPQTVTSVGIVGAGMMGAAIAAAHLNHDLPVVITDTDRGALVGARNRIAAELAHALPGDQTRERVERLVRSSEQLADVARCDLVIESIVESMPAKQQLYDRLQPHLGRGTMLVSNTSTIPIGRLAVRLNSPEQFCGLHFLHPVHCRPLVEVVRGDRTGDQTIARAVAHAKAIDKMPIVVADGPGFLVNRLLMPYLGEAIGLLLEGATIEQIEQAATGFGMAKGPLTLLDEIGLDTTLRGGWELENPGSDRINSAPLLVAMVKAGRLGRKSGAGFLEYADPSDDTMPGRPDSRIEPIVAQWAQQPRQHDPQSIICRLLLPMVLEATRIIEQRKLRDPRDIDLCVLFGLGFPTHRGGLLWWADSLSAARVVAMLQPLQRLGQPYHPTPLLQEMANTAGRFYAQ